ncbi:MAG: hypothetical protein ACOYU3_10415 [Bacillota bacterium]
MKVIWMNIEFDSIEDFLIFKASMENQDSDRTGNDACKDGGDKEG